MAITYTVTQDVQAQGVSSTFTSGSYAYAAGDVVIFSLAVGNAANTPATPTNSGTAQTWTFIDNGGIDEFDAYIGAWYCVMNTSQSMTVSTNMGASDYSVGVIITHTGADETTPVPAGKVYSGENTTDVSQAITPTASGSALWLLVNDWEANDSYAAITNCTIETSHHNATWMTSALIRPTTQPRTDANAFTIGETDSSNIISWVAFEVVSAAGGFEYDESLAPNGVTLVNLTGSYTDIDEDPDSPDSNWLTAI